MARKRLGEILIEAGLIDETGLRAALVEQRRYGGPLGRVLIDLKLVTEDDLVAALSKQLAVPTVDLEHLEIPQPVLELVAGELAESYGMVPFAQPMKFLDVAMSDPTNQAILDELRVKTKLNIRPYLAGPKAIERAVARYYGRGVATARGTMPGRRGRDTVDIDPAVPGERLEVTPGFEIDHAAARAASTTRPPGFSSAGLATPPTRGARQTQPPPPRPTLPPPPGLAPAGVQPTLAPAPAASGTHGPSYADVAAVQERIAALEALVRRDEDVIKRLMMMLIEKGVVSRDELIERLK